jgi:hypothetical protein
VQHKLHNCHHISPESIKTWLCVRASVPVCDVCDITRITNINTIRRGGTRLHPVPYLDISFEQLGGEKGETILQQKFDRNNSSSTVWGRLGSTNML